MERRAKDDAEETVVQDGWAELQYKTIQNTVPYHLPPGFLASTGQWYSFVVELSSGLYLPELACERALTSLKSASYYW